MTPLRIDGFEALVRWDRPGQGLIPPGQFIDLAEETGFFSALGEFVLRTGCRQCAQWQAAGNTHLRVSVNLSVRQFRHRELVAMVSRILAETGLPATALEMEITESTVMQNVDAAQRLLQALRGLGVGIAMDDLHRLRFHGLPAAPAFQRNQDRPPVHSRPGNRYPKSRHH